MVFFVLASALPLSCSPYVPGALYHARTTFDVRSVGCLDVAVRALRDPVIAFTIGNRCRRPVGVDFRNLRVRAWGEDGAFYEPDASDPRRELREAVIDAHAIADVAIDFPVPTATPTFCVDVGQLNVDTPAVGPVEMCFDQGDDGRGWRRADRLRRPRVSCPSCEGPPDLEAWP
jgi:hypothetical protein